MLSCNDTHYVAYLGVNIGATLTMADKGASDPPIQSFLVDTDSLYNRPSKSLYKFFHFILEVARRLDILGGTEH